MSVTDVAERTGPWLELPGLHSGPVRVLSACLDGSLWVETAGAPGSPLNVPAGTVTGLTNPPTPANPHRLTPSQIEVLAAFAEAGPRGLADFEHPGPRTQSAVAEHRLELAHKALIIEIAGESRTNATTTGHVWAITQSGRSALRAPAPRFTLDG
jgi:hypothetical protein